MGLFRNQQDRLAEIVAYFEQCRHTTHEKYGKVIPKTAGRVGMPNVSEADWLAVKNYYVIMSLLGHIKAINPRDGWDKMNDLGKDYLHAIAATHTYDDATFERLINSIDATDAPKFMDMRLDWQKAAAMPAPRAEPGEALGQVLARLHPDSAISVAYAAGHAALVGHDMRQDDLRFLMAYAVRRLRCLADVTDTDLGKAPPFDDLSSAERRAAQTIWTALTAGLTITGLMSELGDTDDESGQDDLGLALAERLYVFQQKAAEFVNLHQPLPSVLPTGAWPSYDGALHDISVFDMAAELARCAIAYHDAGAQGLP